jgi:hypothetical protein
MDYYEMLYGHRLLQSNRKYSNILHNFRKEKQQNYDSEPESDQSEGAMQKKHFFNDFLDDMGSKIKMKSRLDENVAQRKKYLRLPKIYQKA